MTKILQFKKPQPKKKVRKHAPRELAIHKAFDELNEQWHKNEREYTDIWYDFKPHDRKYWKEKTRIWKEHMKLLKKITTKEELKLEIQDDIAKYERDFRKQEQAYYKFIEALKKYDK